MATIHPRPRLTGRATSLHRLATPRELDACALIGANLVWAGSPTASTAPIGRHGRAVLPAAAEV